MKKKVIAMALVLAMCLALTACGKKEETSNQTPPTPSVEQQNEAEERLEELAEVVEESVEEEKYPRDPRWDELEHLAYGAQVQDLFFEVGMTFAEIEETLLAAGRTCEFTPNIDKEMPVREDGSPEVVAVKVDDQYYFTIGAWNPTDSNTALSNCISTIYIFDAVLHEDEYCFGETNRNFESLTVDECKNLNTANGLLDGYVLKDENELDFVKENLIIYEDENVTVTGNSFISFDIGTSGNLYLFSSGFNTLTNNYK